MINMKVFSCFKGINTLIYVFLLSCGLCVVHGQDISDIRLDTTTNGRIMGELLDQLEAEYKVDFVLEDQTIRTRKVAYVMEKMKLLPFIEKQLWDKEIILKESKVLIVLDKTDQEVNDYNISLTSKKGSQLEARIYDYDSNEDIISASIYYPKLQKGTFTDDLGRFSFNLNQDILELELSYVGYRKGRHFIAYSPLAKSSEIKMGMSIDTDQLTTVTVKAKRSDANVSDQRTGVQLLQMKAIKQLPTFLGEVDPIRGVTTLPGVSTTGDIASGFNVRGGENSQNLILQDGAVIFNPTHLFGFFSAFNPDFIQDVSLLKGGGPAAFGGRVSSVLDISTKNGDLNKYSLSGGLGLISSRLTLEGPIKKNKSSFMLGGRLSYSTWFLRTYKDVQLKKSFANFYDISAKYFQEIDDKNFVSVTGYNSYDDFNIGIDSTFSWNTKNVSLKWDHNFNEKNVAHFTLASSHYMSSLYYDDVLFGYEYQNGIAVNSINYLHEIEKSSTFDFAYGVNANFSILEPGETEPLTAQSIESPALLNKQKIIEPSAFVDANIELSDRFAVGLGMRYGHFWRMGEDKIYTLDYNNIDGRTAAIADTMFYDKNETVSQYGGFEPRASLRFLVNSTTSIKAGYYRTQQFIHQVSTTTSPSPIDFWIASSPNIEPQRSNQFSLGYFQNLDNNNIEASLEVFYKKTTNTVDYLDGVDFNKNIFYEAGLTQGVGESKGIELFLKKKTGNINGWLAYTYARSFRIFKGEIPELAINKGVRYSSVYDQPHQLSIIMNYKLSSQATLSTNFTFNTGQPLTIPISKFSYENVLSVNNYSDRNAYRGPDYHRLDISIQIKSKERPGRKYSDEWVLSLYNIYGRKNAYAIYFDKIGQAFKTSILGNIVPSLSYNFKIN